MSTAPLSIASGLEMAGLVPGHLRVWLLRFVNTVVALALVLLFAVTIGPRFLPYRTFTVLSGSMAPTVPVGSVIFDRPVESSELRVGDIITFHPPTSPEKLVSHRISAIQDSAQGPMLVTKGDANPARDDWRIPANGEGLRYSFHIPHLGYIVGSMLTPVGRMAALIIGALWFAAQMLMAIWRGDEDDAGEL